MELGRKSTSSSMNEIQPATAEKMDKEHTSQGMGVDSVSKLGMTRKWILFTVTRK